MTENRRIFWNIVATYGRSLYSLLIGLFTARWALNALGVTDYGLYGVIGGLTVFIGFLNGTLAGANARFYAISIGQAQVAKDRVAALEECRKWFNTAFSIHTFLPAVLIAIGYPVGIWAIENYLTIPPERIQACIWVFRFACLTCFVGMMNVPFGAMYGAKQYIAELTIYSYVTTTLNAGFLYYMISHPGDWLVKYAVWGALLSVVPQLIICIRSFYIFPECRVRLSYMWDGKRLKEIGSFAMFNFLGALCALFRVQGVNILMNKVFGPRVNAAMAIGNSVNGHTSSLGASLMGAFLPVITVAYGEGNMEKMKKFAYRACKLGALLILIFIIPLIAELENILVIWLRDPPKYTTFLCFCALVMHLMDVSTQGHMVAVNASGRVKEYQLNMTVISILTLPAAILTVWLGGGVYALGIVLICVRISISLRRVYYARIFAGLSAWYWFKGVVVPLSIAIVLSGIVAYVPHFLMRPDFLRIVITTVFAEVVLLPLSWYVILNDDEREFVKEKMQKLLFKHNRFRGK